MLGHQRTSFADNTFGELFDLILDFAAKDDPGQGTIGWVFEGFAMLEFQVGKAQEIVLASREDRWMFG
jgi:hypothetical protein